VKDQNNIVYVHRNKTNNKIYIGITNKKLSNRSGVCGKNYKNCPLFYKAIQKYGWNNFNHEILLENLTRDKARQMEIKLIAQYKSNNPIFGYNCSAGGDKGLYGLYNLESMSVKVYQYDMLGNFLKEWASMMEVERELKIFCTSVCACCKGKRKFAGEYQWKYEHFDKIDPIDMHTIYVPKTLCKTVYQYDLNGRLVKVWDSVRNAKSEGFDSSSISRCCNGKYKQYKGYIWKYKQECLN